MGTINPVLNPEAVAEVPVLADGTSTARPLSDRFAELVSVTDFGAKGDGVTDDTAAFNAALAAAKAVFVPMPSNYYRTTNAITVPAGKTLFGEGGPLIKYHGTTGSIGVVQTGGDGCRIVGLSIDGGNTNNPLTPFSSVSLKVTHANVIVEDVKIENSRQAGALFQGANNSQFRHGSAKFGAGPGLSVQQTTNCTFFDIDVSRNLSNFGCYVFESNHNTFENLRALNKGTGNVSLELIGITYSCSHNKVIGCRAEGTGDNGISITGTDNVIAYNHSEECKHAGIYVYGSRNVVVGNHCMNNNQRFTGDATAKFAGITIQSSWGGLAEQNSVTGNTCIDTQTTKTQYAGVRIAPHSYPTYAANTAYTTNSYVANNLSVYKCVQAGTSAVGGTAPTHLSGDVTDGTVIWRYVTTADTNLNPKHNVVAGNMVYGNQNPGVLQETTNAQTMLNEGELQIGVQDSISSSVKIVSKNASPASNPGYAAPTGSLFLRSGGGTGIGAYLKFGAADTNWEPILTRKFGPISGRPTLSSGYEGYMYFDTDLGKPIFFKWNGTSSATSWILADGTAAPNSVP